MQIPSVPSYDGRGLVNLVAEIEHRLTGTALSPRLDPALADSIPHASTYVIVLFDGLGAHQLDHPKASDLAVSAMGVLDAPFPATTTVSLATLATGLPPSLPARLDRVQDVDARHWFGGQHDPHDDIDGGPDC